MLSQLKILAIAAKAVAHSPRATLGLLIKQAEPESLEPPEQIALLTRWISSLLTKQHKKEQAELGHPANDTIEVELERTAYWYRLTKHFKD